MDKVKAIKVLKPLVDSYVDYANISMKEEDDDIVEALEMAIEALKALDVPDMNVGDMISRRAAIDALWAERMKHSEEMERNLETCSFALRADNKAKRNRIEEDIEIIKQLPPAQPEPNYDEWCTDCKEYDHENHCCHRWTKVIRQTRRELQDEFVMTAVDGTLWITVDDVQKVGRVIVDEEKSKFCRRFYMDAHPEQRIGKWIPQDHNKLVGNISTLVYYYPTCSKCGKVGIETYKYCPHCGAKMEG